MIDETKPYSVKTVEQRSEERILVSVPVDITVVDGQTPGTTERTIIEDVSSFGCRFSMRGTVQKGDTVSVLPLATNGKKKPGEQPRLFEVMWVAPKKNGMTVGARLRQGEKLANTTPPPDLGAANKSAG